MELNIVRGRLSQRAFLVESRLAGCVTDRKIPTHLREAMLYSLLAGGKRIRPVLCLTAASLFFEREEAVLPFACGIEMLHTYSLIHDDLPAMDNDNLRRGKPSCHKAFDEATAILAGDALQADAFSVMSSCQLPADRVLSALGEFAKAAGSTGMAGGQMLDMDATGHHITLDALRCLHSLKTGAILRASVTCGALLAGAEQDDVTALGRYGAALGVAFQIADDILDVVADTATLGKPSGSDVQEHKNTYPALVGLERSRGLARQYSEEAIAAIDRYSGVEADFLRGIAVFTIERVK